MANAINFAIAGAFNNPAWSTLAARSSGNSTVIVVMAVLGD